MQIFENILVCSFPLTAAAARRSSRDAPINIKHRPVYARFFVSRRPHTHQQWHHIAFSSLIGTYLRHACGGFGETGTSASYVNQISHLFDCIEMGQSYSFHNGDVTFYNRYVHAPYFRVVHSNLYSLEPAEYDMSRWSLIAGRTCMYVSYILYTCTFS